MTPADLAAMAVAAVVGVAGLVRALTPRTGAETAWVRSVLHELYAEGSYDDGVLYVSVTPAQRGSDAPNFGLGWTLHGPERRLWTHSRAALIRALREHYRARIARAQREAA